MMISGALALLALFGAATADRRIIQVANLSKEVHRMYYDNMPEWFAKQVDLACGAPGNDFTGSYWLFNQQPILPSGYVVAFSHIEIHNPTTNSSGNYDCCLPKKNDVDDDCYRTTVSFTEGRAQIEVDVRQTNNSDAIVKRLRPGSDIYLWVFHDQASLDHCDFFNGENSHKTKLPANVNITYIESPFGLAFNNFVIYDTSYQNNGVYTCYTQDNTTHTFELIFGEKRRRRKTGASFILSGYIAFLLLLVNAF